jgi:3D (Asp-Asp-Asp) domain-containing protein
VLPILAGASLLLAQFVDQPIVGLGETALFHVAESSEPAKPDSLKPTAPAPAASPARSVQASSEPADRALARRVARVFSGDRTGRTNQTIREGGEQGPAAEDASQAVEPAVSQSERETDQPIRMFGGQKLKKARTIEMEVTAYSPDERSCGKWADGQTASGYSVWTNGGKLAAADTDLLPFGSVISVPGYHDGEPIPVLDRGGAIKGKRLDLLYPTHEQALEWGRQTVTVTVWEKVE